MNKLRHVVFCGALFLAVNVTAGEAFEPNAVVAVGNGQTITVEDVERYILDNTPENDRNLILGRPNVYQEIAQNLLVIRTLAAEANSQEGVSLDERQANWAMKLFLDRRNMNRYLDHIITENTKAINWEKMAKEVYLAEKERFVSPEQVRASHILFKTEGRSESDALSLAKQAREKLVAGENFSDLAASDSEDPTAKSNKGDLGFFGKGQMVPEFEAVAFSLPVGAISDPVKTEFGYHVIQVLERKKSSVAPFDSVKVRIVDELTVQVENRVRQQAVMDVRNNKTVELDEELLESLRKSGFGLN